MADQQEQPILRVKPWKGREAFIATPESTILVTFAGRLAVHNNVIVATEHVRGMTTPEDYLNKSHSTAVEYLREQANPMWYRILARFMVHDGRYPVFLDLPTLPPYMTRSINRLAAPRHPITPADVREWTIKDQTYFGDTKRRPRAKSTRRSSLAMLLRLEPQTKRKFLSITPKLWTMAWTLR